MRTLIVSSIALFSLVFLAPAAPISAIAQEACTCKGCGCKGGPGWRGPEGTCVSKAKLTDICGSPPGEPCTEEAAARVCTVGKENAQLEVKVKTEAQ
jgi:hypothetical protein